MISLSDNVAHLVGVVVISAMVVLLVVFAHSYINPDYVFGTGTTIIGTLLGYRFGVGPSDTNSPTLSLPTPVSVTPVPPAAA